MGTEAFDENNIHFHGRSKHVKASSAKIMSFNTNIYYKAQFWKKASRGARMNV